MKRWALIGAGLSISAVVFIAYASGQQSSPSELPGCVYNATPPTLSDRQSVVIQCDVNGKILVH